MNTISTLSPGQEAVIAGLTCSGRQRQRMEDLGFVPGTPVCALHRSPAGDPTAYSVMGSVIALRKEDARHILCTSLCEHSSIFPEKGGSDR